METIVYKKILLMFLRFLKPFLLLMVDVFTFGFCAYLLVQGSYSFSVNFTMCVVSMFILVFCRNYLGLFNKFLYRRFINLFKKISFNFSKMLSIFLVGLVDISIWFVVVKVATYICYFSGVRVY